MKALRMLQVVLVFALLQQASGSVSRATAPGSVFVVRESVAEAESVHGDATVAAMDAATGGSRVARYSSPLESLGYSLDNVMNMKTLKGLGEDVSDIRDDLSNQYSGNYESLMGGLRRAQQSVSDQYNSGMDTSAQVYEFLRNPERVCQEISQRGQTAYNQVGDSVSSYSNRPLRSFIKGFAFARN